jgi:tetratricopeptide (TPR) repeat protein
MNDLVNMGWYHYESGDLGSARRFSEESIRIAQQKKVKVVEGDQLVLLGMTLWKMDASDFETAEKFILEGISISEALKLKPYYSRGYHILGELYAEKGRIDEAREYLEKAEALFEEMGSEYYPAIIQDMLDRL